jgi:hypothetical protein
MAEKTQSWRYHKQYAIEWLAILLRKRQNLGLTFGLNTFYTNWVLPGYFCDGSLK